MSPTLAGLFVVLDPNALEALGRILLTAGKIARAGGEAMKGGFLNSIVEGLSPDRIAESAAKLIGAELDALQLAADVLAVQGLFEAEKAEAIGRTIPDA